uniref:Uncharacterized protein n=1 Tax=Anguilla anguilla TaxID=7936 RepID=A0A0E9UB93_ANGAN
MFSVLLVKYDVMFLLQQMHCFVLLNLILNLLTFCMKLP